MIGIGDKLGIVPGDLGGSNGAVDGRGAWTGCTLPGGAVPGRAPAPGCPS